MAHAKHQYTNQEWRQPTRKVQTCKGTNTNPNKKGLAYVPTSVLAHNCAESVCGRNTNDCPEPPETRACCPSLGMRKLIQQVCTGLQTQCDAAKCSIFKFNSSACHAPFSLEDSARCASKTAPISRSTKDKYTQNAGLRHYPATRIT